MINDISIILISILMCISLYYLGSSTNKVESTFHYAKAPVPKKQPTPKLLPKKQPMPKILPKKQPAPVDDKINFCLETTKDECIDDKNCVHYTCKTDDDANKYLNTIDLKCNAGFIKTCETSKNTVYCSCTHITPDKDGNCPDSMYLNPGGGYKPCVSPAKGFLKKRPACKPKMPEKMNICSPMLFNK